MGAGRSAVRVVHSSSGRFRRDLSKLRHAEPMERWEALARLASGQRQLVATWQAAELGIGHSTLFRRAEEGGWTKVRHRVYLLPGAALSAEAEIQAALLALKQPVMPSGRTAAYLWGLVDRLRRPLEVVTPTDRNVKARGVVVRTSERFGEIPQRLRSGLMLPEVAYTICLLAASASVDELVWAISTAHRKRQALPRDIREAVEAMGKFKGVKLLRTALDRVQEELTHSGLEKLGRGHLRDAGFTPHPKPYTVVDEHGRFVAEVDIAFIAEKVAVEVFGPPHEGREQADHDRRRRLELQGWTVIVVYERRLREPALFIADVKRALA